MAKFLKDFNLSLEMSKMKSRYVDKLYRYGLLGEEKVYYKLKNINIDMLCLYNIRIKYLNEKLQFDFICICNEIIFVIEVKNLLGNIYFTKEQKVIREVTKNDIKQYSSMDNPIDQVEHHVNILTKFLKDNKFNRKIVGILVMANDKMIIINESSFSNIIKASEIEKLILSYYNDRPLLKEDNIIGELLLKRDKEYNYYMVNYMKKEIDNQYIPKSLTVEEKELYYELLTFRKRYYLKNNIPACNVFTNRDAEMLVKAKPKTKKEFISIKGFKEKKYEMFGEEIIKIFK